MWMSVSPSSRIVLTLRTPAATLPMSSAACRNKIRKTVPSFSTGFGDLEAELQPRAYDQSQSRFFPKTLSQQGDCNFAERPIEVLSEESGTKESVM
jgi:hypothetical protein